MIQGHPTDDMLAAYAAGAATEGVSLLVAAHLTYCGRCRREVASLEAIAGAMLRSAPAAEPPSLDRAFALLDAPEAPSPKPVRDAGPLPRPVADAVGAPFEQIRWRFRIPGVSEHEIDLGGAERVSLLRVRPGAGVPSHTHTAEEATLVLTGALQDRGARFGVGDVAVATPEDDHHPNAAPGEECVCLVVMAGNLRFTGALGRALNLFAE
ncbi:MAG: ChrR family anti-sigma-E factor [Rubrimonas sp.]|uniref:ChrR family anti-sigma-E factor n=1 Tax=Rubrimonas sp. TaxID=2036015 RepID=UPI002FDEC69C